MLKGTHAHQNILDFQKIIWDYYKKNKRELPWRNTTDPYKILVSEMMLQQTQVSRVIEKYNVWTQELPTFESLATAPLSQGLKLWSGLGYNRRAMYLQKTARKVVSEYHGKFPDDPKILETFPGIGKNTAGSVAAFAFNKPVVFIETNIRRVFIHHFFLNSHPKSISVIPAFTLEVHPEGKAGIQKSNRHQNQFQNIKIDDKEILPLIEQTLDQKNPREWYYALMDYGSYLSKIVENPNKKSRHYSIQSPLKGSLREARGRILKILSENKILPLTDLEKQVNVENDRFQKALTALIHEGFIIVRDDLAEIALHIA